MMSNTFAYQLNDIQHYYGDKKVLDINTLEIPQGSITGIIGPNGSGKSTLLKLLAFIQKPSLGQIKYNGTIETPFSRRIRSKVTLLTQKPYLLKRTVFENVAYGLKLRNKTARVEQKVGDALLKVGLDHDRFSQRRWHELSGGEAQRVALAARLILEPEVLLLDEPIASVDMESAKLIRQASLQAKEQWGTTLVIVSHDLQWLYSISDQQLSIYQGNIFSTGMENVISGPFDISDIQPDKQPNKQPIKKSDEHYLSKTISDGQLIRFKAPQTEKQTAIIRKENISIDVKKQTEHVSLNQLSGEIATMILEKKTNHIMAMISIQDLSFILRLLPEQVTQLNLYPGKKVILKFDASDVEWI